MDNLILEEFDDLELYLVELDEDNNFDSLKYDKSKGKFPYENIILKSLNQQLETNKKNSMYNKKIDFKKNDKICPVVSFLCVLLTKRFNF